MENFQIGVLLLVLMYAVIIDMSNHRIPNSLTATAAVFGIAMQIYWHGWSGLANGLTGLFAGLLLFLPLYIARWMGAGDVKLMAAAGSFLGWPDILLAIGASMGVGSVAAFLWLGIRGGLRVYLRRYGLMARCLLTTGRFAYIPPGEGETSTQYFPFALAIALGTVGSLWWVGEFAPFLNLFSR